MLINNAMQPEKKFDSRPHLIELRDICFHYPGTDLQLLQGINFFLERQQRVGLVGPNGSGKTSLFHVIMGLLKPESGLVLFNGEEMHDKEDFRKLRRKVGLLFQDSDDQLFSPTVLEDVAFGPLNFGATPQEAREIARQTLYELKLEHLEQRITHQLSGGEKKMVSLATILAMRPDALLLDEPTNNLDAATRSRLIEVMNGLDLALLIISHDWSLLADTCYEVCAMDLGQVTMNDLSYLHDHRHSHPYGRQPHAHLNNVQSLPENAELS
ncbi:MAG: ABC transporter ATP-binding protein [Candidatus Electrothrix aestuarii]|uniref:ABC transporter ATP-binding protein n=1 Tax=Candidatus Electrothrix aestuarii TaxID=3062594 RepID=A0AAU8M009_9BACT|nr:ABC transporter ATP-binding protein [Candidatus Electrothrix aestuarii]